MNYLSLSSLATTVLNSSKETVSSSYLHPSVSKALSVESSVSVTSSTKINVKKGRKIKHKNKISNYLTRNRDAQVKRKTESPQENGPIPPGDLGAFSNKVIRCETFEKKQ